jgi:ribose transport system permease protein
MTQQHLYAREVSPVRAETSPSVRHTVLSWQRRWPVMQLIALVALSGYGTATISGFASVFSLRSMLVIAALLGLASLGQTVVILIGGIDLSVGSFIAAGSVFSSELGVTHHWPFPLVLVALVGASGVVGGATGYAASKFGVQPLVLTLGTAALVLGALQVWLNGAAAGAAPAWVSTLTSPASHTFGVGIPPIAVAWLIVALLAGLVLRRTRIGRWVYATGANPRAARFALVPTTGVWTGAFAASAVSAAIVGVLLSGYAGGGDLTVGNPYVFGTIAAVMVGGTSFVGAKGDYWRTVLGALLLTLMTTILIGGGASDAVEQIIFGALILVVVFGYGRGRPLRDQI